MDDKDLRQIKDGRKTNAQTAAAIRRALAAAGNADGYNGLAQTIRDCSDYWMVDRYTSAMIADTVAVNRCHSRYCAICARIRADQMSRRVETTVAAVQTMYPSVRLYHVVITIPSMAVLADGISRLSALYDKWYKRHDRNGDLIGALRSLEVSYNLKTGLWHPHLHILALGEPTGWDDQRRQRRYNGAMHTDAEITLGEWLADTDPAQPRRAGGAIYPHYEALIRPIDDRSGAIREIAKYPLKPTLIARMPDAAIRELLKATYHSRMVQGRGVMYHLGDATYTPSAEDIKKVAALVRAQATEQPTRAVSNADDYTNMYHAWTRINLSHARKVACLVALAEHNKEAEIRDLLQKILGVLLTQAGTQAELLRIVKAAQKLDTL